MVVEVLAHSRQVMGRRDAELPERLGVADPGLLQDLGRGHRAGAQYDLALAMGCHGSAGLVGIDDAGRGTFFHDDAVHQHFGHDTQVPSRRGRPQVAHRGGHAPAVPDRALDQRDPVLVAAVEVVEAGNTAPHRGIEKEPRCRAARPRIAHPDRAADAVTLAYPVLLVLGLAKVGQHILPAPSCVAGVAPSVVVLCLAADVEHPVDRAGTA